VLVVNIINFGQLVQATHLAFITARRSRNHYYRSKSRSQEVRSCWSSGGSGSRYPCREEILASNRPLACKNHVQRPPERRDELMAGWKALRKTLRVRLRACFEISRKAASHSATPDCSPLWSFRLQRGPEDRCHSIERGDQAQMTLGRHEEQVPTTKPTRTERDFPGNNLKYCEFWLGICPTSLIQ
jgi:hypothetical protein